MSAVVVDAEVAELLRDAPDLLAIADAIAATQPHAQSRSRRRPARYGVLAAAVAIALTVALISPWQGRGAGFVAKALAALGSAQIVHVVSIAPVADTEIVDVRSGAASPLLSKTEVWFDASRGFERVVTSMGGAQVSEVLQTPDGTWSDTGRVYTCAWIAAHPAEATKARVSCNANGVNDPTPRKIPEPPAAIDPALGGFVTGYREALESGDATRDGAGTVAGRDVEWLKFVQIEHGPPGAPDTTRVERVAVDTQTLKPIRVETTVDGATRAAAIATIETLDSKDVPFARPQLTPATDRPVAASVKGKQPVSVADASTALGRRLLWAGESVDGFAFAGATEQQIVTGYGESSGIPFTHSTGIELLYGGPATWDSRSPYVQLRESSRPEMLYGFINERSAPPEGRMRMTQTRGEVVLTQGGPPARSFTLWRGFLVKNGMYVSIEATSRTLLLDAARQLEGA